MLRTIYFGLNKEVCVKATPDEIVDLFKSVYPPSLTIIDGRYLDRASRHWNDQKKYYWNNYFEIDDEFENLEEEVQNAFKNIVVHISANIGPGGRTSILNTDSWVYDKEMHLNLMIYSTRISTYNLDLKNVDNCLNFYSKYLQVAIDKYNDMKHDNPRRHEVIRGTHPYFLKKLTWKDLARKLKANHLKDVNYLKEKWGTEFGEKLNVIERKITQMISQIKEYENNVRSLRR